MKNTTLLLIAPHRKLLGLLMIGVMIIGTPLFSVLSYLIETEKLSYCCNLSHMIISLYIVIYMIVAITLLLLFVCAIIADDELTFEQHLQERRKLSVR